MASEGKSEEGKKPVTRKPRRSPAKRTASGGDTPKTVPSEAAAAPKRRVAAAKTASAKTRKTAAASARPAGGKEGADPAASAQAAPDKATRGAGGKAAPAAAAAATKAATSTGKSPARKRAAPAAAAEKPAPRRSTKTRASQARPAKAAEAVNATDDVAPVKAAARSTASATRSKAAATTPKSKAPAKSKSTAARAGAAPASAAKPRRATTSKTRKADPRPAPRRQAPTADAAKANARTGAAGRAVPPSDASNEHAARPQEGVGHIAANLEKIESLTGRLIAALSQRQVHDPGVEAPGPELFVNAGMAWIRMLTAQPTRIMEQQISYWGETLTHYAELQESLRKGRAEADPEAPKDRRFTNPLWQSHPFFSYIRNQYQTNARALRNAAAALELDDEVARRRVTWLTDQIIDMMAPTNFLATNPDALEKAIETEGDSLVRGLENLVRDIEGHDGEMIVSLADPNAFTVGENIGTTPGEVVLRTPLYELIQFSPSTEQVHATPLVIFPPWINKFYILDLKPQNSLLRWVVEQGYTLFVVSWKNPDESHAQTGLDDYVRAYLEIMDTVLHLTEQPKLNVVGYCIAGTTLSLTLSLLAQQGDERVASATFFTTLTDFSEQGEFTTYLQDDFVDGIEAEISRVGYLDSKLMSRTFSFLRANDLVWAPAIRSYMMGEAPPAFDLLYWNGDSTNLPGKMAMDYLRGLCQRNEFVGPGFEIMGRKLHISDVKLPLCAVACETDHIAPWTDSWRGIAQMGSRDKRFILSESGHIAGIVNPPSKKKYGHYTGSEDFTHGPDGWRESAQFHEGSWWPLWGDWLAGHSGKMVPARIPNNGLGAAPGSYVHEKA